jgi:transaldolase
MRPNGLRTRIFLDGGDPGETRALLAQLGFLDGQTTNPTLISRNPVVQKLLERGVKFMPAEALGFYRDVVKEIAGLLPEGSVSIEVYADSATVADAMLRQGREMFIWIPNGHVRD